MFRFSSSFGKKTETEKMEPGLYEPLTAEEYAAVKIIAEKELERTTYLKREALVWTDAKGHPHREGDLPAIIEPEGDMSWWYRVPATKYWEGLPIGTGRLAAMVSSIKSRTGLCWR